MICSILFDFNFSGFLRCLKTALENLLFWLVVKLIFGVRIIHAIKVMVLNKMDLSHKLRYVNFGIAFGFRYLF